PLTLLYTLQDANLLRCIWVRAFFIIYIIAGSFLDMHSLSAWEVILHQFCPGSTLLIVMIEPNLPQKCESIRTCYSCIRRNKKLQYEYHPMLYYRYADLLHTEPDIIIMFHAKFGNDELSVQNIKALQREGCPVLLTTVSKSKAQDAIMRIQEVLNIPITPIINKQNKFASCRSYRDHKSGSVIFPNEYV
ncbi:hypothetical protein EAI_02990, partial [Harpegnathos saltator]